MESVISRKGVYKNIKDSHYKVTVDNITFYFLSYASLTKFIECYLREREINLTPLLPQKNVDVIGFNEYSDILTYCKCEKRDFYIIYEGVEYVCKKDLPDKILELQTK